MKVRTPHFAIPFSVEGASVAVVEQDSKEEVLQSVAAVVRTNVGSRLEAPEFGIPNSIFAQMSPAPSISDFLDAVEEWEPRARLHGEAVVEGLIEKVGIGVEASHG